ncbi:MULTISPECIES: helix-turn-helix domain-containing protein [Enterococcus]|uniref:helix-turn-helix domain-containing protein n=1 Tax=Enterococcus TaxID=1350 RepID=UPI000EC795AC|nr:MULTISPECIES: helix-turn-helix transcriptional regulator [Enterococcus]HCM85996.1 XRE family transcriptional regulator [Enterococcus sp.]
MTTFERVKKLADKQKISIVELEEKLGFGRNSLYSWKTKTPNGDRLKKVADYFGVSTDYLLGRTESIDSTTNNKTIAKQIMMRSDVDTISTEDAEELEKELERFLNWRLEEIKRERNEKD